MRTVIAISSVGAATSIVAVVLYVLMCKQDINGRKLKVALSLVPEIVILV